MADGDVTSSSVSESLSSSRSSPPRGRTVTAAAVIWKDVNLDTESDDDDDDAVEPVHRVNEFGRKVRLCPQHIEFVDDCVDAAAVRGVPTFMRQVFFTEVTAPYTVDEDNSEEDTTDAATAVITERYGVPTTNPRYEMKSIFLKNEPAPWMQKKSVISKNCSAIRPLFRGFLDDDARNDAYRFALWYDACGGYLPCRATLKWLDRSKFDLTASMAMLADVPDDNILQNRSYPLLRILNILIHRYNEQCDREATSSSVPNLTLYPKIGRLWLMLRTDLFYRCLLPNIINDMRHVCANDAKTSTRRVATTHTMLTILLARFSHDLFRKSFVVDLLTDGDDDKNLMFVAFDDSMSHGYALLGAIFSLFVSRETVARIGHRLLRNVHPEAPRSRRNGDDARRAISVSLGFAYMYKLRDIPCDEIPPEHWPENLSTLTTAIDELFDENLTFRALGRTIRDRGLSFVLREHRRYNFPSNLEYTIHLYFYRVVWSLLDAINVESRKIQRAKIDRNLHRRRHRVRRHRRSQRPKLDDTNDELL